MGAAAVSESTAYGASSPSGASAMVGGRSGEALPLRRGASGTIMWPLPSRSRAGIRQLGYADLGCRTRRWDSYALQPTQPGRGDSVDSARASRRHVSRHAKDWRDICSRDEVPAHHGYVTTPTRAVLVTLPRAHLSHSITYRDVLRALVTPVDHVGVTNTTAWNTPKAGHAAHYKGPPSAGTPASSHRPGHSCAVPFRRGGQ